MTVERAHAQHLEPRAGCAVERGQQRQQRRPRLDRAALVGRPAPGRGRRSAAAARPAGRASGCGRRWPRTAGAAAPCAAADR